MDGQIQENLSSWEGKGEGGKQADLFFRRKKNKMEMEMDGDGSKSASFLLLFLFSFLSGLLTGSVL